MTITLSLQVVLFHLRFPVLQWSSPSLGHIAVIALILNLFVIGGLFNAMINAIYLIAAGGLANIVPANLSRVGKTLR